MKEKLHAIIIIVSQGLNNADKLKEKMGEII